MIYHGEHCKIYLSSLESLADEAARHILANPQMSKELLFANLHAWFVQAQGIYQQQEREK